MLRGRPLSTTASPVGSLVFIQAPNDVGDGGIPQRLLEEAVEGKIARGRTSPSGGTSRDAKWRKTFVDQSGWNEVNGPVFSDFIVGHTHPFN